MTDSLSSKSLDTSLSQSRWMAAIPGAAFVLTLVTSTAADAPCGRYRLTATTAYDTMTLLTWQRGHGPTNLSFRAAQSYCAGLTLGGAAWRLPTLKELYTLVDVQESSGLDPTAFPGSPATEYGTPYYWSSTPSRNRGAPGWVWQLIFFVGGAPYLTDPTSSTINTARCVH
jgi:hypothetical protein